MKVYVQMTFDVDSDDPMEAIQSVQSSINVESEDHEETEYSVKYNEDELE